MSVSEQIDTRTAAGRMVLNILAAVSQWEREPSASARRGHGLQEPAARIHRG